MYLRFKVIKDKNDLRKKKSCENITLASLDIKKLNFDCLTFELFPRLVIYFLQEIKINYKTIRTPFIDKTFYRYNTKKRIHDIFV